MPDATTLEFRRPLEQRELTKAQFESVSYTGIHRSTGCSAAVQHGPRRCRIYPAAGSALPVRLFR